MSAVASNVQTQDIVIDEVFPHATADDLEGADQCPADCALADAAEPVSRPSKATLSRSRPTRPAPGMASIHCRVLEVVPNRRFAFAWKGGDEGNTGYGSPLDTVVTWSLTPVEGRHARARGPFGLRSAEERHRVSQHERRLGEGGAAARCRRRRRPVRRHRDGQTLYRRLRLRRHPLFEFWASPCSAITASAGTASAKAAAATGRT